ncbi:hypothetical protein MHBO_004020 [Bonamia ostreae]|uniref:Uncharacterized protein n=1 Tax=Bonamia ostreae TaxID=126728 RepID=A0ABV2AS50_9EUKA
MIFESEDEDHSKILRKFKLENWEEPYKNPHCQLCKMAREMPCGDFFLSILEGDYDLQHNFNGTDKEFEKVRDFILMSEMEKYSECHRRPETQLEWYKYNKKRFEELGKDVQKTEKNLEKLKKLLFVVNENKNEYIGDGKRKSPKLKFDEEKKIAIEVLEALKSKFDESEFVDDKNELELNDENLAKLDKYIDDETKEIEYNKNEIIELKRSIEEYENLQNIK